MKTFIGFILILFATISCQPTEELIENENLPANNNNPIVLPDVQTLRINTVNGRNITSRDNYIDGQIEELDINGNIVSTRTIEIRGRGNSSWQFPKKSYQIKFDNKRSLLGMAKDERWLLIANYSDKSMMRNEIGYELSRMSNLEFTTDSRYVDLVLNNQLVGTYLLTQKIEVTNNRLPLSEDGYILEIDQLSRLNVDDVYFNSGNYLYNIKFPEVVQNDNRYNYIQNYMNNFEAALNSANFTDPNLGYRRYLDVDSMVDWYIIKEISKTNDAAFWTSVYLNLEPEEKLKMGPVWDFDISFGNINYRNNETTDGFYLKNRGWFNRLFQDPYFVDKVQQRFSFYYNNMDLIYDYIDAHRINLDASQTANFQVWPILGSYVWPNYVWFNTYDEEVDYLEQWIRLRMDWLNAEIPNL
ncbi:MAG: CotH kinase family protein [Nonlabens sp.]